jgi:hypothetical protein
MTNYSQAFRIKQAISKSDFTVSNYFPVVGSTVNLTNTSSDSDNYNWVLNDGINAARVSSLKDESITILAEGGNNQVLKTSNTVSSLISHTEIIYGLKSPNEVYPKISVSSKVCRVGDTNTITVSSIYSTSASYTVKIDVYDANTDVLYFTQNNVTSSVNVTFTYRGAFNIVASITTGSVVSENKQFRMISVTPALQARSSAYNLVLSSTATLIEATPTVSGANVLDGSKTPSIVPGTTVVISLPASDPASAMYRLQLLNIKGTKEAPIVITIDEPSQLIMNYTSWWGIIAQGCEHIVLDGKGYQNIEYGLHLRKHPDSSTGVISFQITSLTNYVEVHSIEFSDPQFTQIMCKTDPDVNVPATLRANFTMQDTLIHNNFMHDSRGEGVYLGYFDASVHVKKNNAGTSITYRPHNLNDTKIYRNHFLRCGWDGLQLNNATGKTEIHDNIIEESAVYGEPDQNTGMSMTLEGKVFNNTIDGCTGIGIQAGALGPLEIYNNIITNIAEGSYALYLLSSIDVPEQFGTGATNQLEIKVYNNNLFTSGTKSTVGAFNVCQYMNFNFVNNVVTTSNLFSGQGVDTITSWTSKSLNNTILNANNLTSYKFGSIGKSNFDIYPDSVLASGGTLIGANYDKRGFKNWSSVDKFIGVNAGIVRTPSNTITLTSMSINNGATKTDSRSVTISIVFTGNPTHYMVSESSNFTSGTWISYSSGTIPFTLSTTQGAKIVYIKIKNSSTETSAINSTITYSSTRQFLVNFTSTAVYNNPSPWNKFLATGVLTTSTIPVGSTITLSDTTLVASNLVLTVSDAFDGVDSNASTTVTYPYPYDVIRWNWYIPPGGDKGSMNLSGCNDTKSYDIIMYGHRSYNGGDQFFTVNGVDQLFNAGHGTGSTFFDQIIFNDVKSVSGVISIEVKVKSIGAFICTLDITEK